MKWSGEYTVNANDIDVNRVVTASQILRYMQDAANWQMETDGLSYDELFVNRGLAFVLSKIKVSMYAPITSHQKITVESWACPSKGMTFQRCYRILREGMIVAEAISAWALVGVKDRKLHRVSEIGDQYGMDEPLELDMPARMKIPEEVHMALVGERTVEYADIDMNGHMNNTRYPDMLCSYLDSMQGRRVISMTLHFQSEAPFGETIKVYHGESDGIHYLRTARENGNTNVEAEIILEELETR
ncbi:MAG: hypothetical protein II979_06175 [Clostridia bacterium]|nr:hypothetical protein [Clostridia bacterium]